VKIAQALILSVSLAAFVVMVSNRYSATRNVPCSSSVEPTSTVEEVLEEIKAMQKVFGNRRESARPLEV